MGDLTAAVEGAGDVGGLPHNSLLRSMDLDFTSLGIERSKECITMGRATRLFLC